MQFGAKDNPVFEMNLTNAADQPATISELSDLQLVLVGGGMGDIVPI